MFKLSSIETNILTEKISIKAIFNVECQKTGIRGIRKRCGTGKGIFLVTANVLNKIKKELACRENFSH